MCGGHAEHFRVASRLIYIGGRALRTGDRLQSRAVGGQCGVACGESLICIGERISHGRSEHLISVRLHYALLERVSGHVGWLLGALTVGH